jgi:hypothetical protein
MNLDRTFAQINTILNNVWNGVYATVAPVLKAASTHAVSGSLTYNLSTFSFDLGTTLGANVTSLVLTNGVKGKTCTVKLKQDATGGRTFVFAAPHAFSTVYVATDERLFPDNVVYICILNHTSHASDHYDNIATRWKKKVSFKNNVVPIMSTVALKVDKLEIEVVADNQYLVTATYDVQY